MTWEIFGISCALFFGLIIFCYALAALIIYWPKDKVRRKRYQKRMQYQWLKEETQCPDWADPALWHKSRREGL